MHLSGSACLVSAGQVKMGVRLVVGVCVLLLLLCAGFEVYLQWSC